MRLVHRGLDGIALLAPPVEGVARLQSQVGLVVPGETEQLRREQTVVAEPLPIDVGVGIDARARGRTRDAHRLARRGVAGARGCQSRRGRDRHVDQAVERRILVALPPFFCGPDAAAGGVETVEGRCTRQLHGPLFRRQTGAAGAGESCCERDRPPGSYALHSGTSSLCAASRFVCRRFSCDIN